MGEKTKTELRNQRRNTKIRAKRLIAAREVATHTAWEWATLLELCRHRCVKCGGNDSIQKDHIIPVYYDGESSDGIENLQPLCARCNGSKGPETTDYRPPGWRTMMKIARSQLEVLKLSVHLDVKRTNTLGKTAQIMI